MAPEVLEQNGHDIRTDVWSLRMVILEMLSDGHSWVKVEKRMVDTVEAVCVLLPNIVVPTTSYLNHDFPNAPAVQ